MGYFLHARLRCDMMKAFNFLANYDCNSHFIKTSFLQIKLHRKESYSCVQPPDGHIHIAERKQRDEISFSISCLIVFKYFFGYLLITIKNVTISALFGLYKNWTVLKLKQEECLVCKSLFKMMHLVSIKNWTHSNDFLSPYMPSPGVADLLWWSLETLCT